MPRTISFNELRRIKSQLPEGSIHEIADKLQLTPQSVRNYFGGSNYDFGTNMGVHIEPGPDGGYVILDDPQILDMALDILNRSRKPAGE
ncbi:MAG: DNA-binding protein [Muribaculaceae bacterium]|nr:DNA-binding protein [Muribaculaceae bacterium]